MPVDATLEAVVGRDRLVVVTALIGVIALSWAHLLARAGMGMTAFEMTRMSQLGVAGDMSGMAMMTPAVWMPGYAVLVPVCSVRCWRSAVAVHVAEMYAVVLFC